jgi:hypothetical protein
MDIVAGLLVHIGAINTHGIEAQLQQRRCIKCSIAEVASFTISLYIRTIRALVFF